MKKGTCILLAVILLLGVVGCADNGSATASSRAETSSAVVSVPSSQEAEQTSVDVSSDEASSEEKKKEEEESVPPVSTMITATASLSSGGSVTFDLTAMADAKTALRNPDKGWYLHYYDDGTLNYGANKSAEEILLYMPYIEHVYMRLPWSSLEPKEGQFNWKLIDKVLDDFAQYDVGVSFRITCKEGGSYCAYATPEWVKNAGAKGAVMKDGSWEPDYGDPIFLEKLENFHTAFAARYAGRECVRYIDVGSYGDYGEGQTSASSNNAWPWSVIKQQFDIYAKCYPSELIVLSDDFVGNRQVKEMGTNGAKIRDYVKEHGWTWRDDSICVNYYMQSYGATDSVRSPFLFDETWERAPIIMELEHYNTVIDTTHHADNWKGGSVFKAACRRTHATYGGFHGFVSTFMKGDNIQYAAEMCNLLGYWYFLDKMDVSRSGNQLTCTFNWRNEGFAKAYNVYDLDLILTDAKGKDHVLNMKGFDNTKIMPKDSEGENAVAPTLVTSHTVDLSGLASGEYVVSVRMHKGDTPVLLALNKSFKGDDGRYAIGKVSL